jgi:hypothetical protein
MDWNSRCLLSKGSPALEFLGIDLAEGFPAYQVVVVGSLALYNSCTLPYERKQKKGGRYKTSITT